MCCTKNGVGKVFARYGLHFATLDRELLATLVAICGNLCLGECGVEDNLLDNLCCLWEEFGEGAEGYV